MSVHKNSQGALHAGNLENNYDCVFRYISVHAESYINGIPATDLAVIKRVNEQSAGENSRNPRDTPSFTSGIFLQIYSPYTEAVTYQDVPETSAICLPRAFANHHSLGVQTTRRCRKSRNTAIAVSLVRLSYSNSARCSLYSIHAIYLFINARLSRQWARSNLAEFTKRDPSVTDGCAHRSHSSHLTENSFAFSQCTSDSECCAPFVCNPWAGRCTGGPPKLTM